MITDKQGRTYPDAWKWMEAVSAYPKAKANAAAVRAHASRSREAEQVARADRDKVRDMAKRAGPPEEKAELGARSGARAATVGTPPELPVRAPAHLAPHRSLSVLEKPPASASPRRDDPAAPSA